MKQNSTPPVSGGLWRVPNTLTDQEFELFRKLIYNTVSINLGSGKRTLVANRLMKRLRTLHLESYQAYYDYVTSPAGRKEEFQIMVDAITTNKTEFFREKKQWEFLESQLWPAYRSQGAPPLKIWSSACSSGEEPYSIAVHACEYYPNADQGKVKILASDISTRMLDAARAGIYDSDRVDVIPLATRRKYFLKGNERYKIKQNIRQMVEYRQINLKENFPFSRDSFDIVFCRNVIIYFDRPTQANLMEKYYQVLKPGGFLFLGHSESLNGVYDKYNFVTASIYQK